MSNGPNGGVKSRPRAVQSAVSMLDFEPRLIEPRLIESRLVESRLVESRFIEPMMEPRLNRV